MDSDSDNYAASDNEYDETNHRRLIDKVLGLNKSNKLKKASRTEPTWNVSEFDLVKSITGAKGSILVRDLTKPLKDRKSRIKIGESVKENVKKSQTLPKPLEKPQAERIRRGISYERTRQQLNKWDPIITSNRAALHLKFPYTPAVKLDVEKESDFASQWRLKTDLQKEIESIAPPDMEVYNVEPEIEKFQLTREEMLEKRREMAKLRAFQSFQEAKARRQSKIKSKKYHRQQKRAKIKEKLKEFEILQKTNPEEALKKLEEIEKARVEERFSLRHKSTGQWARSKQIRAKYDRESRKVLAEQLALSRELTEKTKQGEADSDSDEVDEEPSEPIVNLEVDKGNIWTQNIKSDKEITDFLSGYRKFWADKNRKQAENDENTTPEATVNHNEPITSREEPTINRLEPVTGRKKAILNRKNSKLAVPKTKAVKAKPKLTGKERVLATSDWSVSSVTNDDSISTIFDSLYSLEADQNEKLLKKMKNLKKSLEPASVNKKKPTKTAYKPDLTMPIQRKVPIIDEALTETTRAQSPQLQQTSALKTILESNIPERPIENINPNKFLNVTVTNLQTALPDLETIDDEAADSNRDRLIAEAFEDDDLIEEFSKSKQEDIDKDRPKNIDLSLPGWGSWGGTNIVINPRKRRRFIVKAPEKVPRRDDNKGHLIINEKAQNNVRNHQVSEVPFPFKSVKDYEASIRAPMGATFVPQSAVKKFTKPAVETKMGAIIEPMSSDFLLSKRERTLALYSDVDNK